MNADFLVHHSLKFVKILFCGWIDSIQPSNWPYFLRRACLQIKEQLSWHINILQQVDKASDIGV